MLRRLSCPMTVGFQRISLLSHKGDGSEAGVLILISSPANSGFQLARQGIPVIEPDHLWLALVRIHGICDPYVQ